jgi:hypothetical protein
VVLPVAGNAFGRLHRRAQASHTHSGRACKAPFFVLAASGNWCAVTSVARRNWICTY